MSLLHMCTYTVYSDVIYLTQIQKHTVSALNNWNNYLRRFHLESLGMKTQWENQTIGK